MIVREGPTRQTHHAKVDHDDSVAGPGRYFGGDCSDGWFAKSIRTSIDQLGPEITAGCRTGWPPTAARRSSALGEKPDGSERSNQPGERGARPHDQRHLPRLLKMQEHKTARMAQAQQSSPSIALLGSLRFKAGIWRMSVHNDLRGFGELNVAAWVAAITRRVTSCLA